MWVVTKRAESGWEEIVSREMRLPNTAREYAEKLSKENLGVEYRVHRLTFEVSYSSSIMTSTCEAT
jgi:hypothetical protein